MNEMTQSPVQFGPGSCLLGMVTVPPRPPLPVACLVFNMGANHRVGPHRINVKMAHALAGQGMASLRFDLGGVGDSLPCGCSTDLRERATADLTAAMDLLQAKLGISRFVIFGMCSGAEHAMSVALTDERVAGISLFDGFTFPDWRSRWDRHLRRAWAATRHPAFAGKAVRWLLRHGRGATSALPGFFTDARGSGDGIAWFRHAMETFAKRKVSVQMLFSGSLHVHDRDRDQLALFRGEPFMEWLDYEFVPGVDHTACTTEGQRLLLKSVGRWALALAHSAHRESTATATVQAEHPPATTAPAAINGCAVLGEPLLR